MILGDETWADGDEVADPEHTLENGSSCNSSLECFDLLSWFVDVEGPDDDHLGRGNEVSDWNWDSAQVINHSVDVVTQLSRDWNDRGALGDGAVNEALDVLLLLDASLGVLNDNVDFVLKNYYLVQVHDLNGSQVLACLRLWARLVACYQKQGRIHHCSSCKHSCHEDIVTWAVDKGHVSKQEEFCLAVLALGLVLLVGFVRLVSLGSRAGWAFVQL